MTEIKIVKNRGIATMFGKKLLRLGNATAVVLKMPQWHPPYFTPGREYPVKVQPNGFLQIVTDELDEMYTDPARWDATDRASIGYAVCRYDDTFQGQLTAGQTYAIVGETKGYWLVKRDDAWNMPTDHKFGLYKKKRFGKLHESVDKATAAEAAREVLKRKQREAYEAAEKRKVPAPVEAKPKQYVRAKEDHRSHTGITLWKSGDILVVLREYYGHYDLKNLSRETPISLSGWMTYRFEKISLVEANAVLFADAKEQKADEMKRYADQLMMNVMYGTPMFRVKPGLIGRRADILIADDLQHGPLVPVPAPVAPVIAIPEGKTKVRVTPGVHDSYTIEFL